MPHSTWRWFCCYWSVPWRRNGVHPSSAAKFKSSQRRALLLTWRHFNCTARQDCQWSVQGEDRGSKVFRNGGILLQHYTASQPRRPQLECNHHNYIPSVTAFCFLISIHFAHTPHLPDFLFLILSFCPLFFSSFSLSLHPVFLSQFIISLFLFHH
jgi:hypothetical protein